MNLRWALYRWGRERICPFQKILPYVPSEGKILDVGCGAGLFLWDLVQDGKRELIGLEPDAKKLAQARNWTRKGSRIQFIQKGLLEHTPPVPLDAVTCIDVLHHLPFPANTALQALHNYLKPGGLAVIKEIDVRPLWKYCWNYLHDVLVTRQTRFHYISRERLIQELNRSGFEVLHQLRLDHLLYPHYLVVASKKIKAS